MRRFNFKNVFNCRELGGYCTPDGLTKDAVFLRSDNTTGLTDKEIQQLKDYGLSTVIDLRHKPEISEEPDPFESDGDIDYQNIAVTDYASFTTEDLNEILLSDLYITMSENKQFIRSVFESLAKAQGTVLFHCAAGKDRTGLISALLLKLMGVSDSDVVADYQVSNTYLIEKYKDMKENPSLRYVNLYDSKPETMFTFLNYLEKRYGSIENYFRDKELSSETLSQIRSKFIERIPQ